MHTQSHIFISNTMVEQETNKSPTAKRIKQTISIPFLWEEKPGTPKPNWKRVNPIMQLPIKLIASVPFMWEEKPGTPLPSPFSQMLTETKVVMPSSLPHLQQHNKNNPFYESDFDSYHDLDREHQGLESELRIIHSSPDHVKHHKNNPFCDSSDDEFEEIDENDYIHAPSSPAWETGSIASSYATGVTATSLAGSSFLENMFPLLTPKVGFLETVGSSSVRVPPKNLCTEIVSYGVERKPLTLGEMIMMSRRRSYLKRVVESQQYNHSTELMLRNGYGCCIDVGGLQRLKRRLQLKLIE